MQLSLNGIIYLIFFSSLISCNEKSIDLDYCKMLSDDQSNVNWDKSNMMKFDDDKIKRNKKIINNFKLLIDESKINGFPRVNLDFSSPDSCKNRAVTMTMIHIAQINPNLFFGDKYSKLFKTEIDKGNLDKELLRRSSIVCFRTEEICEFLKPKIEIALNLWDIHSSILKHAKFVKCE